MDQISPAVGTSSVETSGWNHSRSQSPDIGCDVVSTTSLESSSTTPETDLTTSTTNQPCDSFSSVIKAATVTLLNGETSSRQDPQEEVLDEHSEKELPDIEETRSSSDLEHENKKPRIESAVAEGFMCHSEVITHKEATIFTESQDSSISVALEGDDLWQQFHHAGTEMIITKTGR